MRSLPTSRGLLLRRRWKEGCYPTSTCRKVGRIPARGGLDGWEIVEPGQVDFPVLESMPDPDDIEMPELPGYPDVVIEKTAAEVLEEDFVSQEEMNFWFCEPDGGWPSKQTDEVEVLEERPDLAAMHSLDEEEVEIGGRIIKNKDRIPLSSLSVGQVLDGKVSGLLLYLGAVIDIGAHYDGIMPIIHDWEWMEPYGEKETIRDVLHVGLDVKVRVAALYLDDMYRFRFRVQIVEPDLLQVYPALTPVPKDWHAPVRLKKGYDIDDVIEKTGRPYVEVLYELEALPDADSSVEMSADMKGRSDLEWTYDSIHTEEEVARRTKISNAALSPTRDEHLQTAAFFYEQAMKELSKGSDLD